MGRGGSLLFGHQLADLAGQEFYVRANFAKVFADSGEFAADARYLDQAYDQAGKHCDDRKADRRVKL